MASWIVAALLALGASAWVYNKVEQQTGGANKKISVGAAVFCFLMLFFVVWSLLGLIPSN